MTDFFIEDLTTNEEFITTSLSNMTLKDVTQAIRTYDKLRLNRGQPRRARWAKDNESLKLVYGLGQISKSTYYRRLKQVGK